MNSSGGIHPIDGSDNQVRGGNVDDGGAMFFFGAHNVALELTVSPEPLPPPPRCTCNFFSLLFASRLSLPS